MLNEVIRGEFPNQSGILIDAGDVRPVSFIEHIDNRLACIPEGLRDLTVQYADYEAIERFKSLAMIHIGPLQEP